MSGGIFTRLSQRFSSLTAELLDLYNYATLKQQHIMMMCSGAVLGAIVGRQIRKRRIEAGEFSDNIEMVAYNTDSIDSFETSWNRLARFAQKRPDYKHTKLYKAIHWDKELPHYIQLRLWKYDDSIEKYNKLAASTGLMKKVDDSSKVKQHVRPATVIDDSIRRGIAF
ncbi:hypothetical protein BgAZ_206430 [Babesia gibsoni]|uniref:Uncharacterized protein n=1 Tax=Babesia gibsoni TaxID=33632 RepID=A0AAD8LLD4_BABGI|nr:hypothetical protein BgAZ_206430 [Babesia gibsoni]